MSATSYPSLRGYNFCLLAALCLSSLWSPGLAIGQAASDLPPAVAPPQFPLASDYAPPGWPVRAASSSGPQGKLEGLLRNLEAVAGAEVIVVGEGHQAEAKVLLKIRRGARLTTELVQSVADLTCAALPEMSSERVTVVAASGRVLYDRGMVMVAPRGVNTSASYLGGLLAGVLLVAVVVWWLAGQRARRRPNDGGGPGAEVEFLSGLSRGQLGQVLADESPQVLGVLLRAGHPEVVKGVQRVARQRGVRVIPARRIPAPEVWQIIARQLRSKSGSQGW